MEIKRRGYGEKQEGAPERVVVVGGKLVVMPYAVFESGERDGWFWGRGWVLLREVSFGGFSDSRSI